MPRHTEEGIGHHHRDVHGGRLRAAIFGLSDGLVTNASLIVGVGGTHARPSFVRLAGMAGLVAGAFSMAVGEYLSMQAQRELLARELEIERQALDRHPELEHLELAAIYERRGLESERAHQVAGEMMQDPALALETHAREELGIDPQNLGAPITAGATSFVTFALGAAVPLIPWLIGGGTAALLSSVIAAVVAAAIIGAGIGRATGRPWWRTCVRQVVLTATAVAVTYGIGRLVGISGT